MNRPRIFLSGWRSQTPVCRALDAVPEDAHGAAFSVKVRKHLTGVYVLYILSIYRTWTVSWEV